MTTTRRDHVVECSQYLTWPMTREAAIQLADELNTATWSGHCTAQHAVRQTHAADRPGSKFWDEQTDTDDGAEEAHDGPAEVQAVEPTR
jgi:hypothetical protein